MNPYKPPMKIRFAMTFGCLICPPCSRWYVERWMKTRATWELIEFERWVLKTIERINPNRRRDDV